MTHATQREAIAEARELVGDDAHVHVMAPPLPPLCEGEAFCTEVLRAPGAVVVFHARTVDEGAGVFRCIDCGHDNGDAIDAKA